MSAQGEQTDPRRRRLAGDPYRPLYHYLSPANMLKDPNGAIFWKGQYHLFYQHNPAAALDDNMHWGHAVSADLVHWSDLPVALAPTPGGPDADGCWSGCAVDHDGVPTIIYHGAHGGTCIATSDDDMLTWDKYPGNPVIPPPAEGEGDWDPFNCLSVWREGEEWYGVLGGADLKTFLFATGDLVDWRYLHPFVVGPAHEEDPAEDCSVPDFFPLGDRHVMLFSSHRHGSQYYVGTYAGHRFYPERHGRINLGGFGLTSGHPCAPITLEDDRGRRIYFDWLPEGRGVEAQRSSGWAGIICLPRVLFLADDATLGMMPAPELESLRRDHRRLEDIRVRAGPPAAIEQVAGNCLEMSVEIEPDGADAVGIHLLATPDGRERTTVSYDRAEATLSLDAEASSLSADVVGRGVQTGALRLGRGEPLKLRIFLDRSVVEVFANGRLCITKRVYPTRPDSLGVELFARGGDAMVRRMDVWSMAPVWPVAD